MDPHTLRIREGVVSGTATLAYSNDGAHASLAVQEAGASPKVLIEWDSQGNPSATSFRYSFESKTRLTIGHYLAHVRSDSVTIGFASALHLDECLACLPRGSELLKKLQGDAKVSPLQG